MITAERIFTADVMPEDGREKQTWEQWGEWMNAQPRQPEIIERKISMIGTNRSLMFPQISNKPMSPPYWDRHRNWNTWEKLIVNRWKIWSPWLSIWARCKVHQKQTDQNELTFIDDLFCHTYKKVSEDLRTGANMFVIVRPYVQGTWAKCHCPY